MAVEEVYQSRTVLESLTSATATLASIADSHRLVICIGAGFSMATPTELPSGKKLANQVHARLTEKVPGLPACDPDDLTSVADAAETMETGIDLVRRTCLEVADFTTAQPNDSHRMLAMLLLEGEVDAMSWNWDNCVERCGRGEDVLTIIRDEDRKYALGSALLKLHGCARHPTTMLVSTSHLEAPRPWVVAEMAARLSDSVVVFVGIGDVAGYVRQRVTEIAGELGDPSNVYVVSPGIVENWHSSAWADVIAGLPPENRIPASAEQFLESLAASMLVGLTLKVADAAREHPPLQAAAAALSGLVKGSRPLTVLEFSRSAGVRVSPGTPCLFSNNGRRALLALGGTIPADDSAVIHSSHIAHDGGHIHLLVSPADRPAGDFLREARSRLVRARNEGVTSTIRFLYSGAVGPVPATATVDVVGDVEKDSIVAGATAEQPEMVSAASVIEAA